MPAQLDATATPGQPELPRRAAARRRPARAAPGRRPSRPPSALALAARGQTVLLCEVEGRQGIAQLFDVPPLPYEERLRRAWDHGGGRRLRPGDRRRVRAAGVPRHVLPARPRRQGARPVRRDRLRDHDRPGRPGRAADRQGLRGGQPQPAQQEARTYDAIVLDAPPTGRIAAVPQRQQRAGRAGEGRADQVPGRRRSRSCCARPGRRSTWSPCWRRCPSRRPSTASPSCARIGLPVGGVVVNMVRPQDLDATERQQLLDGHRRPWRARRQPREGRASRPGRVVDGLVDEGRHHAERRRLEDSQRALIEDARRPVLRAAATWPAASTSVGSTSSPRCWPRRVSRERPRRPTSRRPTRARGRAHGSVPWSRPTTPGRSSTSTPCWTTADRGIIVCCGSGGVGKTTTSAALALRAAERGRKVVVLTIDPARRLAQSMGVVELDNVPTPCARGEAEAGSTSAAARSTR